VSAENVAPQTPPADPVFSLGGVVAETPGEEGEGEETSAEGEGTEGTGPDGRPKRRRRRRKKGGDKTAEREPAAPPVAVAPPAKVVAAAKVEAPPVVEEEMEELEPVETGSVRPARDEEETEFEDLSTWTGPSWNELIASLYRPER
jgi:hypothetical protein